ncbi:Serine/threonine-protein kinase/endoribonuclease IRE1 [Orchesella cincta]|uniref:Serine/threonine-protein kinase/endoribonuclease IRE1 n=1 Tax=Orchesella cincta TaxID=48709 RepID=A0A1D2M5D8_ORCCI|nr:Serine/threonine-protein kinase/endoribonuclease IRE1 [Orchesella cincta]
MDGLQKTNQTGALKILFEGAITQTTLVDIGVVCVDEYHLLGKGAYGSVFKGKLGDRNVAIKQFKLDPSRIIDAMQEISILKTCDMHENIVKYYGCKHQNEHLLIILEFCDLNLTNWVKNKSIEITPLEVLHQTTKGLSWLHHQKIVHRDLKPENILLTRKLVRVKLSDFGLSRQVADGHSHILTKNDAGTEGWLAPEILNQQLDESSNKFMFVSKTSC